MEHTKSFKGIMRENEFKNHALEEERKREYRLIYTLNAQLIVIGIIFSCVNFYFNFWIVSSVLTAATYIAISNLIMLIQTSRIVLCGHVLCLLCFAVTILGNLLLGGPLSSSYLGWFYVIPIIAGATLGLQGLLIYSLLSLAGIVFFLFQDIELAYVIAPQYVSLLNAINHLSIVSLIFTVMYYVLREYACYETILKDQNYLLHADKKKFHYLSIHDTLTNLPNRAYFNNYLQTLLDTTDITKESISLYFMDLNGFKQINDKYGHEIGDLLLLQVSKRLQSCFRGHDLIARIGGDEFTAVIVHKLTDSIDECLIKRIETEFTKPFMLKKCKIKCSISVGIANYPKDTRNGEELLKIADNAMYIKKRNSTGQPNKNTII